MTRRIVLSTLLVLAALAVFAGPAMAAHNGNNQATLTTTEGTEVGNAVVNYSEGQGTFNGTVRVSDLSPGSYVFQVRNTVNGSATPVCELTIATTSGGCSAQDLALGGFHRAEIVNEAGEVVASGAFARRGNCRDADQAGSVCEANTAPRRSGV